MSTDTITRRIQQQAARRPGAPAYYERVGGDWKMTSWGRYADQIRQAGKALIALGMESGGTVCILGFNRPEWTIMDVGALSVGGVPAGIYTTCSSEEVQYIVSHAGSPVVLLENEEQWRKIDEVRGQLPELKHVVMMRGANVDDDIAMTWEQFLAKAADVDDATYDARAEALEDDQLATLIYTSGTTGPPKGVMLSHRNLAWTASVALDITGVNENDCSLSYLPLSHIAEQMFTVHVPATSGAAVYYAESIDAVPDNLKEVQPTVFFGVPRIWEKFHAGISAKLSLATGVKAKLVDFARDVGAEVAALRMRGQEPGGLLGLKYGIANKVIYSKLKPAIGLGRARVCVSGAAPIAREVLEFFSSLDIIVSEVYGQSEGSGPTSFNTRGRTKFGSVGPAIPGVDVKIAGDGEITLNGPNVFLGYYKDDAATAETLVDGWLRSGDLGKFDDQGFLHITGRKKEIIITAGGKNITPKNIEAALKNIEPVNEAVVIGDRRKFLAALVTLDPDWSERFAKEKGLDAATLHQSSEVNDLVQTGVDTANERFARVEQVKRFTILPRNFTVDDKELTPTLKVKRRIVHENWSDSIEAMYAE